MYSVGRILLELYTDFFDYFVYKIKPFPSGHVHGTHFQVNGKTTTKICISATKFAHPLSKTSNPTKKLHVH